MYSVISSEWPYISLLSFISFLVYGLILNYNRISKSVPTTDLLILAECLCLKKKTKHYNFKYFKIFQVAFYCSSCSCYLINIKMMNNNKIYEYTFAEWQEPCIHFITSLLSFFLIFFFSFPLLFLLSSSDHSVTYIHFYIRVLA